MPILNRSSLSFKIILLYILLTLVNVSVFVLLVFENQLDIINENALLKSREQGIFFKSQIQEVTTSHEISNEILKNIAEKLQNAQINIFSLFYENGNILYETGITPKRKQSSPEERELIIKSIYKRNFENKIFYHKIIRKIKSVKLYIPIGYGSKNEKTLVLSTEISLKEIDQQMGYLYRQCVVIAILVVVIHLLSILFLSKVIIQPVKTLTRVTREVTGGKLKVRVNIIRDDEIGQLANAFNEMTVSLQRMTDEAKGSNPLSGLPGNNAIVEQINSRLKHTDKFAVIYNDLDNFKAYNDRYGFTKGDEAILYTRDCMLQAIKKFGDETTFLGHEGGDDFVIITSFETWENICKAIISFFDRNIEQFYNDTDAKRGYIESLNRQGQKMHFPLMSISIAVVSNKLRRFKNHLEMITVVAEMKKVVKGRDGSCYAIDQRRDDPA